MYLAAILGDFNLKSEDQGDLRKLQDIFPCFDGFIRGPTFQRSDYFSSVDHIFVSKALCDPFYCTAFRNIYSDHSAINLRYIFCKIHIFSKYFFLQGSLWNKF